MSRPSVTQNKWKLVYLISAIPPFRVFEDQMAKIEAGFRLYMAYATATGSVEDELCHFGFGAAANQATTIPQDTFPTPI